MKHAFISRLVVDGDSQSPVRGCRSVAQSRTCASTAQERPSHWHLQRSDSLSEWSMLWKQRPLRILPSGMWLWLLVKLRCESGVWAVRITWKAELPTERLLFSIRILWLDRRFLWERMSGRLRWLRSRSFAPLWRNESRTAHNWLL